MTSRSLSQRLGRARSQRGLSLITTLLFMVAALVLGVSVMGVNVMQERIIGNTKDRDFALQAAEAALRDAEQDISVNIKPDTGFTAACTDGLCTPPTQISPLPATAALPVDKQPGFSWATAANVRTYGQFTLATALPGVSQAPVYVIEKLGNLGSASGESAVLGSEASAPGVGYRITARATGARAETVVFLQSIFATR
jgi:type IV pilus assembly protein PilX